MFGGRPKNNPSKPKKPNGLSGNPNNLDIDNDNDTNKTYGGEKYLITIPEEDLEQIGKDVGVDKETIILKGKSLYDWCLTEGKTKKNYRAFLRNRLRYDVAGKPNPSKGFVKYEDIKDKL